jgi:hypothetical protein
VRGRLQVHVHAHADGVCAGERRADGAVLRQVAVLALCGHAGARRGRVLRRELAHARPRCGLAAPRYTPRAPDAAFLSHLGLPERQRVGLVRRVSHPRCVCVYSVHPLAPPLIRSFVPTRVLYVFAFFHGRVPFSFTFHLMYKKRVFDLADTRRAPPCWALCASHTDTPLTEKLDYFSAALVILYALYMTGVRLFHLYPGTPAFPGRPGRRALHQAWRALAAVAYVGHVSYLGLAPRFDYTYNVIFNLTLGVVHHVLWLQFSVPGSSPLARYAAMPGTYRPAHAGTAAMTVALTTAATALELFDFPPWARMLDAHALWHLATAPLAVLWYDFLVTDAQDAGWRGQRL